MGSPIAGLLLLILSFFIEGIGGLLFFEIGRCMYMKDQFLVSVRVYI